MKMGKYRPNQFVSEGADLLLSFFNNAPFALNSTVCFGSLEKTNAFDVQIGNYRMTAETELIICLVHELSLQLHQHNTGPKVKMMPKQRLRISISNLSFHPKNP